MASGTVACGAFMRNRAAYSTLSRCAVAYLDMLGSRGNSVVAIVNDKIDAIAEGHVWSRVYVERVCHPTCVFT